MYRSITGRTEEEIEAHFAGQGYGALKQEVAEVVIESLGPLQQRFRELTADGEVLDAVLKIGAERAGAIADATLTAAKRATGLL
jgi:tryptophanyl-tRNA synthetase